MSMLIAVCFVTWPLPIEASKVPVAPSMAIVGAVYFIVMTLVTVAMGAWPSANGSYRLVIAGSLISLLGTSLMGVLVFATVPTGKFPDYFLICLVAQIATVLVLKVFGGTPMNIWHVIAFTGAAVVAIAGYKAGL